MSFAGFVAAALLADKVNLNPVASQLSGFAGAFLGTLVARRRGGKRPAGEERKAAESSGVPESPQPVD